MADLSQITLPNNTVYNIKDTTARSKLALQDIGFFDCNTDAGQQVKVCTLRSTSNPSFTVHVGSIIAVYFTNTNTYSATTSAPVKLNVANSGEIGIHYGNSDTPTGTNTTAFGRAGYVNLYIKANNTWVWIGSSNDNNTTYSNMSQTEASTGTATSARSISAKVLHNTIKEMMPSPLSSYHTTKNFSTSSSISTVNVAHNLNTKHIIISVQVLDNETSNTFTASQSAFVPITEEQASEPDAPGVNTPLFYGVKIVDNNNIQLKFCTNTWCPDSGTLYISVISAIAYSSASDESLLRIS